MSIPLFRPTYRIEETLAEIRGCLESGWTGLGGKTLEFETAWKAYTGCRYAHFTNSCTAALHLAVRCLKDQYGWQADDEVLTTPLSFVSTNHVLLYEGLQPVFVDVDGYLCLDPRRIEAAITPRTRAVMFVGFGGSVGRLSQVQQICVRHGLRLIIDAAHMAGTRTYGQMGWMAFGDAVCFSFHAVKNLPTADSGMVCFHAQELDAHARRLAWLGIDRDTFSRTTASGYTWQYHVGEVGWKYHGNAIMAAMALVGLRHLDQDNAWRQRVATWYDALLESVERIPMVSGCESSRHLYQVLVPHRDEVMLGMHRRGVYPGVHYQLHTDYPMYHGDCPVAQRAAERVISLPLHLGMTRDDVEQVATALRLSMEEAHG